MGCEPEKVKVELKMSCLKPLQVKIGCCKRVKFLSREAFCAFFIRLFSYLCELKIVRKYERLVPELKMREFMYV